MIQKFNQFDVNLSGELVDLFIDLEYDDHITNIKCSNLSKCILESCKSINTDLYMTIRGEHQYFSQLKSYLYSLWCHQT